VRLPEYAVLQSDHLMSVEPFACADGFGTEGLPSPDGSSSETIALGGGRSAGLDSGTIGGTPAGRGTDADRDQLPE
jgi:hypothetical protein